MYIEIFPGEKTKTVKGDWFWHASNKGRITGQNQAFSGRAGALRAAKGFITAAFKEARRTVTFRVEKMANGRLKLRWS